MKTISKKIISVLSITMMCILVSLLSLQVSLSASEPTKSNSCFETGEVKLAKETSQICTGTSATTINPSFEQNETKKGSSGMEYYRQLNQIGVLG